MKMEQLDLSQLDERLRIEVEKSNGIIYFGLLSCGKIMLMDYNEFRKLGNFTESEVYLLKSLASKSILPNGFKTANECKEFYKKKWRFISFDCEPIDKMLGGGIPTRGITELSGESRAGKTQICLQFSITVQYPESNGGLGCGAVYICTEDRFPSNRLKQMIEHFPRRDNLKGQTFKFSDNILVDHIADVGGLKECIFNRLPKVLSVSTIGLVIIDSIAAIFRAEYTPTQYQTRSKDMRYIGIQLHKLSRLYNVAVICVNQVADAVESEGTVPALGLVWANLVTTKLQVTVSHNGIRTFRILSAPHLAPSSSNYQITSRGVESL